MTRTPPPEPPPEREPLGFDDFIGIFVAFTSIGAILWWSISQLDRGFDLSLWRSLSSSPSPTATFAPPASPPAPVNPNTTGLPTASPQAPTPELLQPSQPRTVPIVPLPLPPVSTGFSDVPPEFWASPFIAVLTQRGIIEGFSDNTFKPNQPVTRAEFANMLQRAFNKSGSRQPLQFKDIQREYWATSAIDQAVAMGFMNGYPDEVFRPDKPISRVESLVSLSKGLNLANVSAPGQVLSVYRDTEQIPRYAVEKIATATTAGLVVNYPDPQFLKPQQVTTRADAAALIYQALVKSGQAEKISSPYIVQP